MDGLHLFLNWDSSEPWSASIEVYACFVVEYDFLRMNLNFVLPLIRSLLLTSPN